MKIKELITIAILSVSIVKADKDSILVLAEKCSYQLPPEYPDSLDIMYNSPFERIREGIRFEANSKGNDLNGYKFLINCYFNGKILCVKSKGPNKFKCNRITEYLNNLKIKPWEKEISKLFQPEPVKLLITWTQDACIIERIISIKEIKKNESKLFIRKWEINNF
jgi:hypothetical protein